MFRGASRMLNAMCEQIHGTQSHFGKKTVKSCFQELKKWSSKHFVRKITNQDLVGFFTSVEQPLLQSCVDQTIQAFENLQQGLHGQSYASFISKTPGPTLRGKWMKSWNKINITIHQLSDIVKLALLAKYFRIGDQTIMQIRGCLIGNQIAPTLCNIAIFNPEIRFRFQQQYCKKLFCAVRYVDNLLCFSTDASFMGFQADFYTSPIELEDCTPINEYLGVQLLIQKDRLSFKYMIKPELFHYQHEKSAGSRTRILSSLCTRAHMAIDLSHPISNKIACIHNLFHKYMEMEYKDLDEYKTKFMRKIIES
jgi:hypothetical protein